MGYRKELETLQIQLGRMQTDLIENGRRMLVIFEGRDAAGKGGTIKRITEHMRPRQTRVVALPKPTDREQTQWYYQRWIAHLPAAGEIVLFDRSWYNRAGVERVMGFCDQAQYDQFMDTVPALESMLVRDGIHFRKYYLDIERKTQEQRFDDRRTEPLKTWKMSPIDEVAQEKWHEYTLARDQMFARTHTVHAPWSVVNANDKKEARINVIRDLLADVDYVGKDEGVLRVDPDVVFRYNEAAHDKGKISK